MSLKKTDFPGPTIVVAVNDEWTPGRAAPSLCDCACGFWNVGDSIRALACEWLVAVHFGNIVGVWGIDQSKGLLRPSQMTLKTRTFNPLSAGSRQRGFSLTSAPSAVSKKLIGGNISDVLRLCGPFGYIGG